RAAPGPIRSGSTSAVADLRRLRRGAGTRPRKGIGSPERTQVLKASDRPRGPRREEPQGRASRRRARAPQLHTDGGTGPGLAGPGGRRSDRHHLRLLYRRFAVELDLAEYLLG